MQLFSYEAVYYRDLIKIKTIYALENMCSEKRISFLKD